MNRKCVVKLTNEQRQYLEKIITSGTSPAQMQARVRILLKPDSSEKYTNWSSKKIVESPSVSEILIRGVRKRFSGEDFETACSGRNQIVSTNIVWTKKLKLIARSAYEYQRNGVAGLFRLFEPLQGKHYIQVKKQH